LGVSDRAATELKADLRQLGRLSRAGLAREDDDLMRLDGPGDLVVPGGDGQGGIVRADLDRTGRLGGQFR
jgi:hypothetical protein